MSNKKPETAAEKAKWCADNGCAISDFGDAWAARLEMLKGFDNRVYNVGSKLLKKWGKHRARKFGFYGASNRRAANVNHAHYNWDR